MIKQLQNLFSRQLHGLQEKLLINRIPFLDNRILTQYVNNRFGAVLARDLKLPGIDYRFPLRFIDLRSAQQSREYSYFSCHLVVRSGEVFYSIPNRKSLFSRPRLANIFLWRLCIVHGLIEGLMNFFPTHKDRVLLIDLGDAVLNDKSMLSIGFCSDNDCHLLIPDPDFINSYGYQDLRDYYETQSLPWKQRRDCVLWRGSTTGQDFGKGWENLQRAKLCLFGKAVNQEKCFPVALDFGFSKVVHYSSRTAAQIEAQSLVRDFVSPRELILYKFHMDCDGNSNAWSALFLKMLSAATIFKIRSPLNYRQWYYDRLLSDYHYWEVGADLSDLDSTLKRAVADPVACEMMASRVGELSNKLTYEDEVMKAIASINDLLNA